MSSRLKAKKTNIAAKSQGGFIKTTDSAISKQKNSSWVKIATAVIAAVGTAYGVYVKFHTNKDEGHKPVIAAASSTNTVTMNGGANNIGVDQHSITNNNYDSHATTNYVWGMGATTPPPPVLPVNAPNSQKIAFGLYQQGQISEASQNFPEAISKYKQSIASDNMFDASYQALGLLYLKHNNLELARTALAKSVIINPRSAVYRVNYADVLSRLNDASSSLKQLKIAAKIDPDSPVICSNIAALYLQKFDLKSALSASEIAIKKAPDDAYSHAVRGAVLRANNDLIGSISELNKSISLDANLPLAHYTLAKIYVQSGQKELAISELKIAFKYDPSLKSNLKLPAVRNIFGPILTDPEFVQLMLS